MKKQVTCLALTLLISSLCSGCGEKLIELTPQEEALIVQYSAKTLAKYNIYQKDGQVALSQEVLDEALYEAPAVVEPDPDEPLDPGFSVNPETGMVDVPEDIQETGPAETLTDTVTLAESIGQSGVLDVNYEGYYVADSYKEGSYYFVDAKPGKKYLVMQYTISNPTSSDVTLDVTGLSLTYYVSVNGGSWIAADPTFSLVDIATYQGKIAGKSSIKVISLFLVNEDLEGNINSIALAVEQNGVKKRIF